MYDKELVKQRFRETLMIVLDYMQWSDTEMCKRAGGISNSTMSNYKALGTYDLRRINQVAGTVGLTANEWLRDPPCEEIKQMVATLVWNPLETPEAMEFTEELRSHLIRGGDILALQQEPPCSWLTKTVLERMYNSYFKPIYSREKGRNAKAAYKRFGLAQRERFLDSVGPPSHQTVVMIPRCDFEKMVWRQRPFDQCSKKIILKQLDHLGTECIDLREQRLVLIDTPSVEEFPDVRDRYGRVDSIVVVNGSFTFRREMIVSGGQSYPRIVHWSSDPEEVERAETFLRELLPNKSNQTLKQVALEEIDNYAELLETP